MVVIIGKDAKNVAAANALEYVAAYLYTIGNNVCRHEIDSAAGTARPLPH